MLVYDLGEPNDLEDVLKRVYVVVNIIARYRLSSTKRGQVEDSNNFSGTT